MLPSVPVPVLPWACVNVGGPHRMARSDMAAAIAAHLGVDPGAGFATGPAPGARPVASPSDISMDVSRLAGTLALGRPPTAFHDTLPQCLPPSLPEQ